MVQKMSWLMWPARSNMKWLVYSQMHLCAVRLLSSCHIALCPAARASHGKCRRQVSRQLLPRNCHIMLPDRMQAILWRKASTFSPTTSVLPPCAHLHH